MTAPDGDRLPATNSGQETPPCGDRSPGQPAHIRCRRPLGHEPPHRWENEYAVWEWEPAPQQPPAQEREPGCHADRDGECSWRACPQLIEYQGHCPLDVDYDDELNRPDAADVERRRAFLVTPLGHRVRELADQPAPPSEADSAGEALADVIESLAGLCVHGPCPGPDEPFEDMVTCRVCSAVQDLRALAAAPGVQGGDGEARDPYGHTAADHEAAGACRRPSMDAHAAAAAFAVLGEDWQRAWKVGYDAGRAAERAAAGRSAALQAVATDPPRNAT